MFKRILIVTDGSTLSSQVIAPDETRNILTRSIIPILSILVLR